MGIFFGICAALCWGAGDFLITQVTRRIGTSRAMVGIQTLSLLGWMVLLVQQPGIPTTSIAIWGVTLLAGVCHVLGLVLTYRAFEIGTLSLVSPIASGFAVVTAALALFSGSEQPPALTWAGSALLIIGIVLATTSSLGIAKVTLKGVPEAIGSALAFGTMFWIIDVFVAPTLGFIWPLVVLKLMAVASSLVSLVARQPTSVAQSALQPGEIMVPSARSTPAHTSSAHWVLGGLAVGAAATDMLAWASWTLGTRTEYATVVTALASLFSVVTILLAWKLLRERLTLSQWSGIAVILLGILAVSV